MVDTDEWIEVWKVLINGDVWVICWKFEENDCVRQDKNSLIFKVIVL